MDPFSVCSSMAARLAMEGKSVVSMEITFMDNGGKYNSYI